MIKDNKFAALVKKLEADKPKFQERTRQALDWYKTQIIAQFPKRTRTPLTLFDSESKTTLGIVGSIMAFEYNPKHKATLEYYDKFPLILVLKLTENGFYGLNFHYLRPLDRAIFMNRLYKYAVVGEDKFTIGVTYEKLSSQYDLRYYKPCIKRYLFSNVSTKVVMLEPQYWDVALFLPTEKFLSDTGGITDKEEIQRISYRMITRKRRRKTETKSNKRK